MANLAEMVAEVKRIVEDRVTVLDAAITNHIQRAQRSIEDKRLFPQQKATVTTNVSTLLGSAFLYPSDYIAVRDALHYKKTATDTKYTFMEEVESIEHLGIKADVTGPPKYWVHDATAIVIYPTPDDLGFGAFSSYEIVMPYWKRLSTLEVDADSNYWSLHMDDVLAWKAAANVFSELRDPMAQFWNAVAMARFKEIVGDFKRGKLNANRAGIYPRQSLSSRQRDRYGRLIVARVPS